MLNDFRKKCLERGNIMSTDTLIITINTKALAKIADEGDNLYRSVICYYMLLEQPHVQSSDLVFILTKHQQLARQHQQASQQGIL